MDESAEEIATAQRRGHGGRLASRAACAGRARVGRVRGAASAVRLAEMTLKQPYQMHDTPEQVREGQIEVGFVHEGSRS